MARQHLVRARGYACAFQRSINLEVLSEALDRLLRFEREDGYLIFQLAVENMDPAAVAAERGVSPPILTEMLRDAVDALAVEYEDVANKSLDPRRAPGVRPALARRRG
jgi:acetolactate synthase regulatory subunit